jgi:hypothetical protein
MSNVASQVAQRLDVFLAREPDADPVERGQLFGRLESALEYLLSELMLEQHGIGREFDGFMTKPGADTGWRIAPSGILELTGGAYLFGPPYSLWPFHGKLARHPATSVLCLSGKDAIAATGSGTKLRIPPDPLGWPYVMTTALPAANAR